MLQRQEIKNIKRLSKIEKIKRFNMSTQGIKLMAEMI